jgi:hypothetical protein
MSIPAISLGVKGGWPTSEADNLTAICEPIVFISLNGLLQG